MILKGGNARLVIFLGPKQGLCDLLRYVEVYPSLSVSRNLL